MTCSVSAYLFCFNQAWTLIVGSNWVSLSWLASLFLALALLAIGCGGLYLASKMKRIAGIKNILIPRLTISRVVSEPIAELKKNSGRIGLLVIGLMLGWSLHAAKQFNHTYVLNDVKVLKRQSADHYLMQTDHYVDFTFKSCPDSNVDFDEGSMLKVLVYEDRGGCDSVSDKQLGYIVKRDSAGRPVIKGE